MNLPFKTLQPTGIGKNPKVPRREMLKSIAAGIAFSAAFPFSGFSQLNQEQSSSGRALNGKNKVLIDTDPGVDDALAIMGALAADELDILFLTTVFGNGPVESVTANAKYMLNRFGAAIPVYRGCSRAILDIKNTFEVGKRVFGEHYLGELKPPGRFFEAQENTAAFEIARAVKEYPHQVTIFAIGPLTNIAMAVILYPEICRLVKKIVIMGGAVNIQGNCNQKAAECNFFSDPHAAQVVLSSTAPIVLVPLNATRKAILIESQVKAFLGSITNSQFKAFFQSLLSVFLKMKPSRHPDEKSCTLHDPLALEVLLTEGLGKMERMDVQVELNDPERLGATLGERSSDGNIEVVVDFEYDAFMDLFFERMRKLAEVFQPE